VLDIQYTLSGISASIAEIDKYTGVVTLKQSTTNTATANITIKLIGGTTISKSSTVSFIWSPPAIGDFAYIDGTFSAGYDPNKTVVGMVYARDGGPTDTSGTVYIIGKEYSNPVAHYGGFTDDGNTSSTDDKIKNLAYVGNILARYNLANYNIVSDLATSSITHDISINNKPSESNVIFKGDSDTLKYVNHVGQFLQKIADDSQLGRYIKSENIVVDGNTQTVYRIDSIANLNSLAAALVKLNVAGMSSDTDIVSCALYPYFYSAYLYEPVAEHGEVIDEQYLKNKWYAPSYGEMSRIAFYRGYSSTGNTFINSNDVRSAISTSITNGGTLWTTPVFSLASKGMGNAFPTVWGNIFGSGNSGTTANIVTTVANGEQNYSYQAVGTYSGNTTSYTTQWIPGQSRDTWYGTAEYTNGWRLTKHQGIPFTKYNYSKS